MNGLDLRFSEVLISRLCHELVGAAGAIGNGVEYLNDSKGQAVDSEVISLMENSSAQLTSRLKFYRVAYGFAGNAVDNIAELRSLAIRLFEADTDIHLSWQMAPIAPELQAGEGRLVLNMILLAKQSIALSGDIDVDVDEGHIIVSSSGPHVKENTDFSSILNDELSFDELTARNIHEYLTLKLAEQLNMTITQALSEVDGKPTVSFTAQMKA